MADPLHQPAPWLTGFQLTDAQVSTLIEWVLNLKYKQNRKYLLTKEGHSVNVLTNFEERLMIKG